jgi:hypothetical protein
MMITDSSIASNLFNSNTLLIDTLAKIFSDFYRLFSASVGTFSKIRLADLTYITSDTRKRIDLHQAGPGKMREYFSYDTCNSRCRMKKVWV